MSTFNAVPSSLQNQKMCSQRCAHLQCVVLICNVVFLFTAWFQKSKKMRCAKWFGVDHSQCILHVWMSHGAHEWVMSHMKESWHVRMSHRQRNAVVSHHAFTHLSGYCDSALLSQPSPDTCLTIQLTIQSHYLTIQLTIQSHNSHNTSHNTTTITRHMSHNTTKITGHMCDNSVTITRGICDNSVTITREESLGRDARETRDISQVQVSLMGWLRSVGSIKLYVSFAEYCLFYRALLQKRPII